jgi:3-phosphoglycerate kinase
VEEDKIDLALSLMEAAAKKGVKLLLPTDVVVADKFAPDANSQVWPLSSFCKVAGTQRDANRQAHANWAWQ